MDHSGYGDGFKAFGTDYFLDPDQTSGWKRGWLDAEAEKRSEVERRIEQEGEEEATGTTMSDADLIMLGSDWAGLELIARKRNRRADDTGKEGVDLFTEIPAPAPVAIPGRVPMVGAFRAVTR